jgi:3-deoxy-D-manno-octulosonic-acid transferase
MNRKFYTLWLYVLSPVIWLYFLYRGTKDPRYLKGLKQRMGFAPRNVIAGSIHIHCASVGETRAAIPLLKLIAQDYACDTILITTTTPTGRGEVLKLIDELQHHNTQHCYLPLDWPGACKRFLIRIKPKLTILMETELWPNLLNQLANKNIPILLANARLSDSSLKKYQKHLPLSKELFSTISRIAAQYESDRLNFESLGVAKNKIDLIGSIKFDIALSNLLIEKQRQLKQQWTKNRACWIAASIHPAEFDGVLDTHKKLLAAFPDLLLIAVPRHPERFDELKQACQNFGLSFVSRSEGRSPEKNHSIVVGDSMGELTLMCGAADIAFVGGSLIEKGGHNPIEPAACGLPVIMGPSNYNFSDVSQILQKQTVLEIVSTPLALYQAMQKLLSQPSLLHTRSQATENIFAKNRGAVDKIISIVNQLLNQHNSQNV